MAFSFFGGIHPKENKHTRDVPVLAFPEPDIVVIPMSQHIGIPCKPLVKKNDYVKKGQKIGDNTGLCVPIHASVSGTVKKIDLQLMANGKKGTVVVIESDGLMTPDPSIKPPAIESFADLSAAARAAGLVGLGGAGFPTSVKLDSGKLDVLDTLVLNGAECEPYITSDTRTMLDKADEIRKGI